MRGKTLRRITTIYYESCYVRLSRFFKFRFEQTLRRITDSSRDAFVEAADQCGRLGAKPGDYVRAQFDFFDWVSGFRGRTLIPTPRQLCGEKAAERWRRFADGQKFARSDADAVLRSRRTVPGSEAQFFEPDLQLKAFARDERKLANLAVVLRLDRGEILRRFSGEFSPDFVESFMEAS